MWTSYEDLESDKIYYRLEGDNMFKIVGYISPFTNYYSNNGEVRKKWMGVVFQPNKTNDNNEDKTDLVILEDDLDLIKLKFQMCAKSLGWDILEIK